MKQIWEICVNCYAAVDIETQLGEIQLPKLPLRGSFLQTLFIANDLFRR